MKTIILTIFSTFLINIIFAQDTILFKNMDEIKAKVIEISPNVIRYKIFDDLDGPDIIVNKSEVFMIKYQNHTKDVFGNDSDKYTTEQVTGNKVKVIIYRPKKFTGAAIGYNLYADDSLITRITNGTYHETELEPGTVTFSATTEARTEMPMKLEPGKTYYLKCTISMGVLIGRPDLNFVPESIGVTETTKLKNK